MIIEFDGKDIEVNDDSDLVIDCKDEKDGSDK